MKEKQKTDGFAIAGLIMIILFIGLGLSSKNNDKLARAYEQTMSAYTPQTLIADIIITDSLPADRPQFGEIEVAGDYVIPIIQDYNHDDPDHPFIEVTENYKGLKKDTLYLAHIDEDGNWLVENGDEIVNLGKIKFFYIDSPAKIEAYQPE